MQAHQRSAQRGWQQRHRTPSACVPRRGSPSLTRVPRAPAAAPQPQPRPQSPLDHQQQPAAAAPLAAAAPPRRAPAPPAATAVRVAEAAAAPPRDVEVEFLGVLDGMQTVRGIMEVDAHPDLVYSILTDYDRCSEVRRSAPRVSHRWSAPVVQWRVAVCCRPARP